MPHHKRKRPKNRRAGCLMCKPEKMNGYGKDQLDKTRFSDAKRRFFAKAEVKEAVQMRNSSETVGS